MSLPPLTQLQSPRPKSEQLQTTQLHLSNHHKIGWSLPRKVAQLWTAAIQRGSVLLPLPNSNQPQPTNSDIRTTESPAPSYLNPALPTPTRPEEVQIQGTQPLSNKRLT